MYLTKETFEAGIAGRILKPHANFLPGPATLSDEVRTAMGKEPISHRSIQFDDQLANVKNRLKSLTNATHVQLLQGTGTLANDVIAGQLSLVKGRGLILVNGEFGRRLTDHASRFALSFDVLEKEWGSSFATHEITSLLTTNNYAWIWMVHSETSTGILNDFRLLVEVCKLNDRILALDCISSIGCVPIDLTGVSFASGVSGKGLASYTGLSFVFHAEQIASSNQLPRYLDLGAYVEANGVPYSQSSNLLAALEVALERYETPETVYKTIEKRAETVRNVLATCGVDIQVAKQDATPAIVTLAMPSSVSAIQLGDNLFMNGFNLHYESAYLRERNWVQIACLNDVPDKELDRMLRVLCELLVKQESSVY